MSGYSFPESSSNTGGGEGQHMTAGHNAYDNPFAYSNAGGLSSSNGSGGVSWSHQQRMSGLPTTNNNVFVEHEHESSEPGFSAAPYGGNSSHHQQQQSLNHVVLVHQQQLDGQQHHSMDTLHYSNPSSNGVALSMQQQHLQPQANPYTPAASNVGAHVYAPQSIGPQSYNPKIFVGGLSWSSNETSLQQYFSQFGAVDSVEIMRDRLTGNPRGFAFVIFAQDIAVDRVLAHAKHIIDCKLVDVKRAHARSNFNDSGQQSSSQPPSKSSSPVPYSTSPPKAGSPPDGNYNIGHVQSLASSPVNSVATYDSSSNNHRGGASSGGAVNATTKPPLPDVQQNKIFIGGLHHAVDREELKHYFSKYGKVCDACVMFDPVTRRSRGFGFITYDANEAAQRAISDQVHSFRDKTVELKLAQPKAGSGPGGGPGASATVTPTKGSGGHHARAMSTIDFRPGPMSDRTPPGNSGGQHVRSSSAGADLMFANANTNGTVQLQHIPQQQQQIQMAHVVDRLSLETMQVSSGTTPSRRNTSVGHSTGIFQNQISQQQQLQRGGSFVLASHGSGTPHEGGSFLLNQTPSHAQVPRGTIPSLVNVPAGLPPNSGMRPGVAGNSRNGLASESQGLSELETALYRRVSHLEGQLASAQAGVFSGQQLNSQLRDQMHDVERQVTDTRRSERALISMLNEQGGAKQANFTTASKETSANPWGAPNITNASEASEADIAILKSIVTGLNGRLGNHDADVSERLLVSALFAEGQTDQALMDVIVELDERLATIENGKKSAEKRS
jgi:RNA recognition motif-containing protein